MSAKQLYDRNLLVSSKKNVKTELALKYAKQEIDGELSLSVAPARGAAAPAASAGSSAKRAKTAIPSLPTGLEELLAGELRGNSPIIILPSASNTKARISCLNAVEFLLNGKYEEPNSKTKIGRAHV